MICSQAMFDGLMKGYAPFDKMADSRMNFQPADFMEEGDTPEMHITSKECTNGWILIGEHKDGQTVKWAAWLDSKNAFVKWDGERLTASGESDFTLFLTDFVGFF